MTIWDGPAPAGWARDDLGWWREVDDGGLFSHERYTRPTPGRFVEHCTHALYAPGDRCSWCGGQVPSSIVDVGGVDGAAEPVGAVLEPVRPAPAAGGQVSLFG